MHDDWHHICTGIRIWINASLYCELTLRLLVYLLILTKKHSLTVNLSTWKFPNFQQRSSGWITSHVPNWRRNVLTLLWEFLSVVVSYKPTSCRCRCESNFLPTISMFTLGVTRTIWSSLIQKTNLYFCFCSGKKVLHTSHLYQH